MSNQLGYNVGKILCKGSGLKAYFEIKLKRKNTEGKYEYNTLRYEVGNLNAVMAASNRQVSWNYVAGNNKPVGVNKGIRSMYGTVVFTQLDQAAIVDMVSDVKIWNSSTSEFQSSDTDMNIFDEITLASDSSVFISDYNESLDINVYSSDVLHLDDLPPIDIVIVGNADNIDDDAGTYEANKTYQYRIRDAVFVSDTFGISAGSPIHDVSTKILILGGIDGWHKAE